MKRFIPILFLASFSSPAMADIIHQISASTQLQVQAASTHSTRIGSTYAVSGNNIELGTTSTFTCTANCGEGQTPTGSTNVTTSDMGGLTAGTAATSLDAATMVNGTYQIKTAGDAFSLTESLSVKREKVHDVFLKNLTSALDNIRIYHAVNGHYPWEHPKCDHAFLAQDHHMEGVQEGEFIRKS